MNKKRKSKKQASGVLAFLSALLIVVLGGTTFAWSDVSQFERNEFKALNYGAKLNEEFTPEYEWEAGKEVIKRVFVSNEGSGDLVVRIRFKELLNYEPGGFRDDTSEPAADTPRDLSKEGQIFKPTKDIIQNQTWDSMKASSLISWNKGTNSVVKSIDEYVSPEAAWFYDETTGWFYWGEALKSNTETTKLLETIKLKDTVQLKDNLDYIIHVDLHAFSASDSGLNGKSADGVLPGIIESDSNESITTNDAVKILFNSIIESVRADTETENNEQG